MEHVTVGTKYQIVIPKAVRKKIKGIKPGVKVVVYSRGEDTITIKIEEKDWVERTRGIAKEAWENIDPIAELNKMRNGWEVRLKGLEKEFK